MKGRLEHSLQIEKNIKEILSTLPQYVTEYYYEFKSGRQPTACREYIRKIAKFLYFIDSSNVKQINPKQITKFDVTRFLDSIEYIMDNNGNKKQSSLSYRKCYHSVLKSFFDFLTENDYITENPMNKIKRVRGEDFVNRKFLDEDDLKEVLLAVECGAGNRRSVAMQYKWKSRDRAIMMLFMQTGIRETALSEINIEDIDFENHIIKSVIEKGHKDRTFTMSPQLEKAILDWMCDREKIIDKNEDALFISKSKTRMTQRSLSDIVIKYTKEALGYSVTPHKLRASFATNLYEATGDIQLVQEAMNHTDVSTTQLYVQSSDRNRKRASSAIESIMNF